MLRYFFIYNYNEQIDHVYLFLVRTTNKDIQYQI
jgi:hypothetical protein